MANAKRYSPEVRERAVRLIDEYLTLIEEHGLTQQDTTAHAIST